MIQMERRRYVLGSTCQARLQPHIDLVEVRLDGQFLPWCNVAVRNIPNLRVFLELARRACPNCLA